MTEIEPAERSKGFAGADYNAVAVGAELHAIDLLESSFKVEVSLVPFADEWQLSHNRKAVACHYDEDAQQVATLIQFQVRAKSGRKQAMKCTAMYGVFYQVPEGSTREAAMAYCKHVGTFAAYPYFRSFVAQLIWSAGLQLPPMPNIASTAHVQKNTRSSANDAAEKELN